MVFWLWFLVLLAIPGNVISSQKKWFTRHCSYLASGEGWPKWRAKEKITNREEVTINTMVFDNNQSYLYDGEVLVLAVDTPGVLSCSMKKMPM